MQTNADDTILSTVIFFALSDVIEHELLTEGLIEPCLQKLSHKEQDRARQTVAPHAHAHEHTYTCTNVDDVAWCAVIEQE